jgi:hypothetical protein
MFGDFGDQRFFVYLYPGSSQQLARLFVLDFYAWLE